jgi:hypothetical protein
MKKPYKPIWIDDGRSKNANPRIYKAEDNVAEAISAYLESKRQQEAS